MERNSGTTLLFLLPALLHVCKIQHGSSSTIQHESLNCYNDYNANITCVWDSTNASDLAGNACGVHAQRVNVRPGRSGYESSCMLETTDVSRPALKKCSLIFSKDGTFMFHHVLSISLNCSPVVMSYKPVSHIKLYPPGKPFINSTTVSWLSQVIEEGRTLRITNYTSELQWKPQDESWSGPSVQKQETLCELSCEAYLDPDLLIRHTRYEARTRVKPSEYESFWSDWSPTASWISSTGKPTPPSPDDTAGVFWRIVVGTAAFALFLVIVFKTDKTWVYVVAKIRGPLLPDPGKSFLQDANFQTWLSPHFSSGSFHSLLKPEEISSVEVTCGVASVVPCGPEAALQDRVLIKSRNESTSSSFFPSYSHMCPSVTVLTAGNLERSAADTTCCPFRMQDKSKTAEQEMEEEKGKQLEILHLFSKVDLTSECLQVTSDYEKVEKSEVERLRLQSLDSGVCSGEEVSQESLEADSVIATGGDDEEEEEEETRNGTDVDFQSLFSRRGSIPVCYDYEQVQKLLPDTAEPHSLDSGASSGGVEQIRYEEKSTNFLFPPSGTAVSYSMPSCTHTPPPLSFSGSNLNPREVEMIALLSTSGSLEPSDDDYMHV